MDFALGETLDVPFTECGVRGVFEATDLDRDGRAELEEVRNQGSLCDYIAHRSSPLLLHPSAGAPDNPG